jgi:protein-arginine deiminase
LPAVRLLVDTDRDGTIEDTADDFANHAAWDTRRGAVLLANVDDDDGDHAVDATDETVNGTMDEADLARVRIAPWRMVPTGAQASLSLDMASADKVTLFRHAGTTWTRFDPAMTMLTANDLHEGVEFGIEAKDFPSTGWNGQVEISLTVTGAGGAALGNDRVVMRTAPWVINNSLDPTVRIFGPQAEGVSAVQVFTDDLVTIAEEDQMPLTLVNTLRREYYPDRTIGPDVWLQDVMEFGWTAMPAPGGMHAMNVVLRSPNPDRPLARYSEVELLGPDLGYVLKRATRTQNGRAHDPSLDSFGDLEILPPYRNGDENFPLGRVLHGSVETRHSDVALRAFLEAQGVQGPPLYLDTSWLHVGHVDEFLSFVPANTPRGWKLLVASPRLARQILQESVARDPANGRRIMFQGKFFFTAMGRPIAAQRTVNDILADATLMALNQSVQARITTEFETVRMTTGLTDDEIVEIPFLFQGMERGTAGAYMPGTINLLFYNRTAVVARPYGPLTGDNDLIEDDMIARLLPFGVNVRFAEQWDILHAAGGEVHCGSNAIRQFPTRTRWWEVAR